SGRPPTYARPGHEKGVGIVIAGMRIGVLVSVLVSVLGLAALPSASQAQTQQQLDWCNGKGDATAEQKVVGCTALIQSGQYTGKDLAIVYYLRGKAQKDRDKALADYNEALKLDPSHVGALSSRALT